MALDAVDLRLVQLLSADARATNASLATSVSVAPSTAHTRLHSLLRRGVITGFHAATNQSSIGNGLQAMIGVSLQAGARQENIHDFVDAVCLLPQVVQMFFVSGSEDFLIHVAVPGVAELRQFVLDNLSGQRRVASTKTSVIFEYRRNQVVSPFS